jgi:hypothetical protein
MTKENCRSIYDWLWKKQNKEWEGEVKTSKGTHPLGNDMNNVNFFEVAFQKLQAC